MKMKNKTLDNSEILALRIKNLEMKRRADKNEVRFLVKKTYASFQPINLIKGLFANVNDGSSLQSELLKSVASLVGGYASKKIIVGKTNGVFKNILGSVVQVIVSNFIAKKLHRNE